MTFAGDLLCIQLFDRTIYFEMSFSELEEVGNHCVMMTKVVVCLSPSLFQTHSLSTDPLTKADNILV
jgi:hypothetical protein